jgi:hypothetical protein
VGLIARAIEAAGIATLSLSSARDITRAAWPPRSAYLDFPLGHTSGRPHQPELNTSILRDTMAAFESLGEPGSMAHLSYRWSDTDGWKDRVFAPSSKSADEGPTSDGGSDYGDDRVARHSTPQFQTDADEQAALAEHDGEECLVCAGIDY